MWGRRKKLTTLHEELTRRALLDRLHAYSVHSHHSDHDAHDGRELRRSQIIAEIEMLRTTKPGFSNHGGWASAILLLCVGGSTTVSFLLH